MGIRLSAFTCAILVFWHCVTLKKLRVTPLQKVVF